MSSDKEMLDWLDAEMPLLIERDGTAVLVVDSESGQELGRGVSVREAIWNAMRGDSV